MTNSKQPFAGKVALVTGSTQGLGAGIARRFAGEGAKLALCGRSEEKGQALKRELEESGTEVHFTSADLSNVDDCRRVVDEAMERFGRIDILVNSAGDTRRSTLENFTPDFFDYQFAVNVKAPLVLAQQALPSLKANDGVMINIGSVNAYMGGTDLLVYSATKGALMTASRNLANALKRERVRVFCLNIGWTDTDGERVIHRDLGRPDDYLDGIAAQRPLGRLLNPKDIAAVCTFLASDEAHAFSGAVIDLEQQPVGSH